MKAIQVVITINEVDNWAVHWDDLREATSVLHRLNTDVKEAISDTCGIDPENITITSTINTVTK